MEQGSRRKLTDGLENMRVKESQKENMPSSHDDFLLYLPSGPCWSTGHDLEFSCRLMLCDPTRVVIEVHSLTSTEVIPR